MMTMKVLLLVLATSSAQDLTDVRISNQPATYWGLPPFIAQQEGFFADLGLNVSFVTYPSGAPQVNDASNWDMGATGTVPCILGASLGIKTIGISNDESAANAVVGAGNWPVNNLTGVALAVTPNSTGQFAVEACLVAQNIDTNAIDYIYGQQPDVLAALDNGTQYGGLWAPNTYQSFLDSTDWSILCTGEQAGVKIPGGIIVNTEAFGDKHDEITAKILTAWLRGIWYIQEPNNFDSVMLYMTRFYRQFDVYLTDEAMREEVATRPLYNLQDQLEIMQNQAAGWFTAVAEFMAKAGVLDSVPAADTYLTSSYLERVASDERLMAFAMGEALPTSTSSASTWSTLSCMAVAMAGSFGM